MPQSIQVNGQTISYPETGDPNWGDNATNFAIQTSSAFGKLGLDSGTSVDIPQTLDVTGNTTLDANLSVGGVIYADDNTTANTPVISFTGDTNTGIGRSAADTLDFITNGNSRFRIMSTGQLQGVISGNVNFYPGFLCRAWVNFDGVSGSGNTIRGSGNISSVVRTATGFYTINIDIDMPDANYVVSGIISVSNTNSQTGIFVGNMFAGSFNIVINSTTGVAYNEATICLSVIR